MESYLCNRRKAYQFYLIILCAHRNLQEKNGDTKKAVRIKSSNVNKDMINFEEVTNFNWTGSELIFSFQVSSQGSEETTCFGQYHWKCLVFDKADCDVHRRQYECLCYWWLCMSRQRSFLSRGIKFLLASELEDLMARFLLSSLVY